MTEDRCAHVGDHVKFNLYSPDLWLYESGNYICFERPLGEDSLAARLWIRQDDGSALVIKSLEEVTVEECEAHIGQKPDSHYCYRIVLVKKWEKGQGARR